MRVLLTLLFISLTVFSSNISAQCTPPAADDCANSNVLCSLDELNGYACNNPNYSNPTGCNPLCPTGGAPHNTSWWAFVTEGGNVCITINFANCIVNGTGVQMGIWGDCDCGESIVCHPECNGPGSYELCGELQPCKIYYLFVDGCSGDVCEFTINTSGGKSPKLEVLKPINNDTDKIIEVCPGICFSKFFVELQSNGCLPQFMWTLDGTAIQNEHNNDIFLNFDNEGDFVLCATAIIGNPTSGSICDQEGPVCATIKVRKKQVEQHIGPPVNHCFVNGPYIWEKDTIKVPGKFSRTYFGAACCPYDSVVEFISKSTSCKCSSIKDLKLTNPICNSPCKKEVGDTLWLSTEVENLSPHQEIVWFESTNPDFDPLLNIGNVLKTAKKKNNPCKNCPELRGIFVDACSDDVKNEYVIIYSGAGFSMKDLILSYDPSTNPNNFPENNNIGNICSITAADPLLITGVIAQSITANDYLPENSILVLFTSNNPEQVVDLSDLQKISCDIYVAKSSCRRTTEAFTNANSKNQSISTTLSIANCSCSDNLVYKLNDAKFTKNGDFYLADFGVANNNCFLPKDFTAPIANSILSKIDAPFFVIPPTWANSVHYIKSVTRSFQAGTYCCSDVKSNNFVIKVCNPSATNSTIRNVILCDTSTYYVDELGNVQKDCAVNKKIGNKPNPNQDQCDTSLILNLLYVNPVATISYIKNVISVDYTPLISLNLCHPVFSRFYTYNWYEKSNPTVSLTTSRTLNVQKKGEYCVDITVHGNLNGVIHDCLLTVCEKEDEGIILDADQIEKFNNIDIIPNPTNGEFNLINKSSDNKIKDMEIYDQEGKLVYKSKLNIKNGKEKINISNLPASLYYVKINTQQGNIWKRIVKE